MTRWLLGISLLLVLPLATLALLLGLATSSQPRPPPGPELGVADMERGREVWRLLGLGRMREGQEKTLTLSGRDLDLGMRYLAERWRLPSAGASVGADALVLRASLPLPGLPVARYLNVEMGLAPAGAGRLEPARLRLGTLPLPAKPAARLLGWGLGVSPLGEQYRLARDMLRAVHLARDEVRLTFVWRGQALEKAMGEGVDEATLDIHRRHLAEAPERDLAPLLGRAMALARQRSRDGDPAGENRAALTALAEHVLGARLGAGTRLSGMRPARGVRLAGRPDYAQHFALSAFIAATGGERLSDLAGLYKELADAREGSGFSFNDLAADRAGSRLGESATRSAREARRVQAALAGVKDATVFFPRVDDLPEYMGQAEFQRRFGGVDAPAYQAMVEKIEARIGALEIYR